MILTLQPVGRVDASVLQRIGSELAPFGEVRIAPAKPLPGRAFGLGSKRYRAAMFDRVCRWAVVSLSQFGGQGEDKLVERAVKTAVHELGHTLGLGHHGANPQCVMFFSEKLADTDRKSRDFCRACADSAKLTLSRLRT